MILKQRYASDELKILRALQMRKGLSSKESSYYLSLEKGLTGELLFDQILDKAPDSIVLLHDLLLECDSTIFQLDTLLLTDEMMYLFEVKNYEGDFFIENEQWYTLSKTEIKNPLLQLKRSETLLRKIVQESGFSTTIKSYLIFINPEFHLYQAPMNLPIIYPTQIDRFMKKLFTKSSSRKERHIKFAKNLLTNYQINSSFTKIPKYTFEDLEKGILCPHCFHFMTDIVAKIINCKNCGHAEQLTAAILRSTEEFKLLFPDKSITVNHIFDWCKIISSKKTIRRILSNKYPIEMRGRNSFFRVDH